MRWLAAAVALAFLAGCSGTAVLLPSGPSLPDSLLGPATSSVLVEVSAVEGRLPDLGAIGHLRATLANVTGKAVVVTGPTPIAAQGGSYDEADLRRIHGTTTFFGGPDGFQDAADRRTLLHVLYLDGRMEGDDGQRGTLGRSIVDAGIVAIFRDTYSEAYRLGEDGPVPAAHEMDHHVLLHEAGHALGLVGNGVPMLRDHAAEGHPGHSRYPESVMYHHPPMTPAQLVTGPVSTAFDVDDLADLAAHRARLHRGRP